MLSELDKANFAPVRNLLPQGSAESGLAGFKAFTTTLDANGMPGTITIGATSVTLSLTQTNPLSGKASWQFAKASANAQGQGVISDAFLCERKDLAKVLQVLTQVEVVANASNFDASGSSTQSIELWVYNVGAGAWIQPTGYRGINQTSGPGFVRATFQTDSTPSNNQYRVALICRQTAATAFTFNFEMSVAAQVGLLGPAVSDWQSYTPTLAGAGTVTSVSFWSRRVGSDLEIRGNFTTGTGTATTASITLGYNGSNGNVSLDTTKIPASSYVAFGTGYQSSGTSAYDWMLFGNSTAPGLLYVGYSSGTQGALNPINGSAMYASSTMYSFFARVPIAGWASNIVSSADYDGRVCAGRFSLTSGQTINTASTALTYTQQSIDFDLTGSFNWSTGVWTAPSSGVFVFLSELRLASGRAGDFGAYVNGALVQNLFNGNTSDTQWTLNAQLKLNAGDQVQFKADASGSSTTVTGGAPDNFLAVHKLSGTAVPQAPDSVGCLYTGTATGTINGSTNNVFPTKQNDSNSAYSNGVWTCPLPGRYSISTAAAISITSGSFVSAQISKNGTALVFDQLPYPSNFTNSAITARCNVQSVNLNAGDQITVQFNANGSPTFSTGTFVGFFSIARTGN